MPGWGRGGEDWGQMGRLGTRKGRREGTGEGRKKGGGLTLLLDYGAEGGGGCGAVKMLQGPYGSEGI